MARLRRQADEVMAEVVTQSMDPENMENFRGFPQVPDDSPVDIPWNGAMLDTPDQGFEVGDLVFGGVDFSSAEARAAALIQSAPLLASADRVRETVEIGMNSLAMTLNPTDRVWVDGHEYVVTAVVHDSISLVAVEDYVKPEPKPEPKPVYVEQPTGKRMIDVAGDRKEVSHG